MLKKFLGIILGMGLTIAFAGCVVVPYTDSDEIYQCALSSDKKVLRIVNLTDGDTSFYQWNEEFMAFITVPTTAILSSIYVIVNNTYHIGEKLIKCD